MLPPTAAPYRTRRPSFEQCRFFIGNPGRSLGNSNICNNLRFIFKCLSADARAAVAPGPATPQKPLSAFPWAHPHSSLSSGSASAASVTRCHASSSPSSCSTSSATNNPAQESPQFVIVAISMLRLSISLLRLHPQLIHQKYRDRAGEKGGAAATSATTTNGTLYCRLYSLDTIRLLFHNFSRLS